MNPNIDHPYKFYKVVRHDLKSWVADGELAVQYTPGKWIKAPGKSRLFVCCDLETARHLNFAGDRIFECEVKDVIILERLAHLPYATKKTIRTFWNGNIQDVPTNRPPLGFRVVHAARQVKLTKEIEL